MMAIEALLLGLLTVGIQGTSLSTTRMKSASAKARFWNGWFQ